MTFSRTVRLGNKTASPITVEGVVIAPGAYYDVDPSEQAVLASSSTLFSLIGAGDIVVNRGADLTDDITDPLNGWKWLAGDYLFPTADDGSILVSSSGAGGSSSPNRNLVTVSIHAVLGRRAYTDRILNVANGEIFEISLVHLSAQRRSLLQVDWMVWDAISSRWRPRSPTTDPWASAVLTVSSAVSPSDTDIDVAWPEPSSVVRQVSTNTLYRFTDLSTSPPTDAVAAIMSFSSSTMRISLDRPIGVALSPGTRIHRIEESSALLMVYDKMTQELVFDPPLRFVGDDMGSFLRLRVQNLHYSASGLVSAMLSGSVTRV